MIYLDKKIKIFL